MDVLISGCGIAGPTLAWWLARAGHTATIVEKAPALRTGGYVIDFWGKGYDLAERMGLMPRLQDVGYHVREVRFLDDAGKRRGSFGVDAFTTATMGRFVSLPRGELASAIHGALPAEVKTRYGCEVAAIEQDERGAAVMLSNGTALHPDLVVGAEGIHSRVRDLVFGPEAAFERFLGYGFAAWTVHGYPHRDETAYIMHGEPGRQVARFTLRGGATLILLIWREDDAAAVPHDTAGKREFLRRRYAGGGWEVPEMIGTLDSAEDLYLDRVSQIEMEHWQRGRVALVGDAAYAPSFLAGQGSALAMIGAYVLAGELARAPDDIPAALKAYEGRLAGFMASKQNAARGLAGSFVPKTRWGVWLRDELSRVLNVVRSLRDQIALPDYFAGVGAGDA
jgi:2-polyprenyl-6-methoxyphenol hydroxylase-like FAD-dependent oxidoreductase